MSFHYKVYFASQNVQIFILNSTGGGGGGGGLDPWEGRTLVSFTPKDETGQIKNTKELQEKL